MNLSEDFPTDRHITYDWYAPSRRHRLDDVLAQTTDATAQEMVDLQSDYVSIPAQRILAVVRALPIADAESVPGLELLLQWDGDLQPDSRAALLFEVWYRRHLRPALLARAVAQINGAGDSQDVLARIANKEDLLADARIDLDLLENPGNRLGPDPGQFLAETVTATIKSALADIDELVGGDQNQRTWGRVHVARAQHPLKTRLTGVDERSLAVGPLPRGGSGDTVGNTAYGPNFVQSAGSTFRVVVDVGDWDSSLAMNAPGQSGNLDDPHYTDLFEPWASGEAFPLLYSRDKVEEAAEHRIRLTPTPD